MRALTIPAYVISSTWDVMDCNEAFRLVWSVGEREIPFNAVERMFVHPVSRKMHGRHFEANIKPVLAMLHSSLGRQPHSESLRRLRDRLTADEAIHKMWSDYEISSPLLPNTCTIASAIGTFTYEALTLPVPGYMQGIVVQVPDSVSRQRLAAFQTGSDKRGSTSNGRA
jgi:hypothetical protein